MYLTNLFLIQQVGWDSAANSAGPGGYFQEQHEQGDEGRTDKV